MEIYISRERKTHFYDSHRQRKNIKKNVVIHIHLAVVNFNWFRININKIVMYLWCMDFIDFFFQEIIIQFDVHKICA